MQYFSIYLGLQFFLISHNSLCRRVTIWLNLFLINWYLVCSESSFFKTSMLTFITNPLKHNWSSNIDFVSATLLIYEFNNFSYVFWYSMHISSMEEVLSSFRFLYFLFFQKLKPTIIWTRVMCYSSCKPNKKVPEDSFHLACSSSEPLWPDQHPLNHFQCGRIRANRADTDAGCAGTDAGCAGTLVAPPLVPTQPISALLLRGSLRSKWWRSLACRPAFSSIALLLPLQNVKGNAASGGGRGPWVGEGNMGTALAWSKRRAKRWRLKKAVWCSNRERGGWGRPAARGPKGQERGLPGPCRSKNSLQ